MLRKSRITSCVFWMIRGSWCSKSRLAKAAGAEVALQHRIENGTPLWREAHFEVKMLKTPHSRSNFWSSDLEKWHAAVARTKFWSSDLEKWHATVARSTFVSQNVQKHCRKIPRRCGPKCICKSKSEKKTEGLGHFLKPKCRKNSPLVS